MTVSKQFVERRNDSFYLIGSRVPLALIVREFQNGEPPEVIRSHFPTLNLEQIYGAITFYLGNQQEAEEDMAARQRIEEDFSSTHPAPPELKQKLDQAREQMPSRRG